MKISLCMIVKNEEKNIINCLDRALNIIDEAIIVDTGSEDRTREIIQEKYGRDQRVKLIEYKWEDDFSKARNESLKHVTGDWILVLDADERIFGNRQELEGYISDNDNQAFIIPIYNFTSKENFVVSSSMIRLFKNNNPSYEGAIHEQITINGEKYKGEIIDGSTCKIYHYGYLKSIYDERNKVDRNMDIILSEIQKEPHNPFHWYNKGVMQMIEKNYEAAMYDFIKSHQLTKNKRMGFHSDLVIRLIQCMILLKKYKKANTFIKTIYKDPIIGKLPDLYYSWGITNAHIKKYPLAIKNFIKAIEIGEYEDGVSQYGTGSFLSKIEWAKVLLLEKKTHLAIEKFKDAVLDPHNIRHQGWNELKHLLTKENRIHEIEKIENTINQKMHLTKKPIKNDEFVKYKEEVKRNIKILVEEGKLEDCKELIKSYEEMVEEDIDIYSIRGVIAIMEGDLVRAEEILLKGLDLKPFNNDILFNLAYLYELQEKFIVAYRYYKKLYNVANEELEKEVAQKIELLEKNQKIIDYNNRKKVLFIAHIFPPVGGSGVQRSLKFVKYLRNFGWEPVVVTVGETRYPLKDQSLLIEIPEEIEIIRINEAKHLDTKVITQLIQLYYGIVNNPELMEKYINKLNSSQQYLNQLILLPDSYILWAIEVINHLDDKVDFKNIDCIYTTSGPYSDHIIGYYLKMRHHKPWVADFRDEWTNNPYANYDKDSIFYRMNLAMENNIVHFADKVLAVTPLSSENYRNNFHLKESKVETITNGYDEEDFVHLKKDNNLNKQFTIFHNGLLYSIRKPDTFMKAVKRLINSGEVDRGQIKVIFGWTENLEQWTALRDELDLGDVVDFLDYMDHAESLKLANAADLLLLIVGEGEKSKVTYPGKLFEYLRLSKPILALSPRSSEVESLIRFTNRGSNFDYKDIEGISNSLLNYYKSWKDNDHDTLYMDNKITKYERKNLAKKIAQIFTNMEDQYSMSKKTSLLVEKDSNFYDSLFEHGGLNDNYHKHYRHSHYFETWLKAVELISVLDNPKIIDIGCGPGQFANLLFDNNIKNYKGIDFSPEAIRLAKEQNKSYCHLFKLDNAYTTDLFSEDYNVAIVFEFLEHIDHDLKIIERIKKNTTILFSVPNFYSDGHVRWFNSKLEVYGRYKDYIEFNDIYSFNVGGTNKIFLAYGKIK